MMRWMIGIVLSGLSLSPPTALAGPAQQACLQSERSPGANTCRCVQQIADQTLSPEEQRLAAGIIAEPELFDAYLFDDSAQAQGFVERYRAWGERASRTCRG